MNLDQLRYFVETARLQHQRLAASRLNVTAGAVGQAIRALESELGIKLFQKTGRRVQLTAEGVRLKQLASDLLDQAAHVRAAMTESPAVWKGTYRIISTHSIWPTFLSVKAENMQLKHPQVFLEVSCFTSSSVIEKVAIGEADLGFCFNAHPHPDVRMKKLVEEDLLIAVRPGHLLLTGTVHEKLKGLSEIWACSPKPYRGIESCEAHPELVRFGVSQKINFFYDSYETAVGKLRSSDSWTLMPKSIVQANSLESIRIKGWAAKATIFAVWPKHRSLPKPLQCILN